MRRVLFLFLSMFLLCSCSRTETRVPVENSGSPGEQVAKGLQWTSSLETAIEKATAEKKDLFLLFTGSDWCIYCRKFEDEILSTRTFVESAPKEFAFVYLDFPQDEELQQKVDMELNRKLQSHYGAIGFPRVVLAHSDGTPYATTTYFPGGPDRFLGVLAFLKEQGCATGGDSDVDDPQTRENLVRHAAWLYSQGLLGAPACKEIADAVRSTGGLEALVGSSQ